MSALALQSFGFEDQLVRVLDQEGAPWFVAQDICACLEIANSRDAVGGLDDDEKGVANADTLGGPQSVSIVSESGLYALIFKSRKPAAVRFRKWVTSEVLPTLRRTGQFAVAANDTAEEPMALDQPDEIERMKVKLALIREARQVYGRRTARAMWEQIGLPEAPRRDLPAVMYTPDAAPPHIQQWLEERTVMEPKVRTDSTALYRDYVSWCEEHDESAWHQSGFGRALSRSGIRTHRSGKVWRLGIRLND